MHLRKLFCSFLRVSKLIRPVDVQNDIHKILKVDGQWEKPSKSGCDLHQADDFGVDLHLTNSKDFPFEEQEDYQKTQVYCQSFFEDLVNKIPNLPKKSVLTMLKRHNQILSKVKSGLDSKPTYQTLAEKMSEFEAATATKKYEEAFKEMEYEDKQEVGFNHLENESTNHVNAHVTDFDSIYHQGRVINKSLFNDNCQASTAPALPDKK